MTPATPKYASSKFYDVDKDVLKDGASDEMKREYEKLHNGVDWELFYKELHPEMKKPFKKWNGEVVDKARMDDDDDDESGDGGHGNTKLPFGLCRREGIEVQSGWTPQDAWNALEGKGYNAKEAYKELKETGKVSSKVKAFKYERPAAQDKAIKSIIRRTAHLKNEQSRIVDADGNVIAESKGDQGSVGMKVGTKREHLTGNVIIHNHPRGGTFSPDDLDDFGYGAKETVVACKDGAYSLVNAKFDNAKERYNGWYEMRHALEDAMENSEEFEDYRLAEYKLRNKIMQEQKDAGKFDRYKKIQQELLRMHDEEGVDLTNPTGKAKELLDEYNTIEENLAKERKDEVRRRVVKPFDDFYRKNAEKYGFVYTFTPAKKRRKDSMADAEDAIKYRSRREQRLRSRYGEHFDAVMAFRQRRSARLDARAVQLDDENWKTIKGTHVEIGDGGKIVKGPERLRNLTKTGGDNSVGNLMKPGRTDYDHESGDGFSEFQRKNVDKLMPTFKKGGMSAVRDEYYKFLMDKNTKDVHQISKEDAEKIIEDNISSGAIDQWYHQTNSKMKPKLVEGTLNSPEVRNATLNLAYSEYEHNCKQGGKEPLPFKEFLTTPIEVYRGGHGQKHIDEDVFSSYSLDRETAERYAGEDGTVTTAKIRPIDTFGTIHYFDVDQEIWVPRQLAPNGEFDSADGQ